MSRRREEVSAFRPGREMWPFGRRPPTREVTTGRAPMDTWRALDLAYARSSMTLAIHGTCPASGCPSAFWTPVAGGRLIAPNDISWGGDNAISIDVGDPASGAGLCILGATSKSRPRPAAPAPVPAAPHHRNAYGRICVGPVGPDDFLYIADDLSVNVTATTLSSWNSNLQLCTPLEQTRSSYVQFEPVMLLDFVPPFHIE